MKRFGPRARGAIVVATLAAGFLLPLRGLLRSQGPPMEEGFMLVFPEQILRGELPNRDFLHLYGPGSLWWLAAVFEVFGTRLEVQRLAALAQMVAVVGGIAVLARRWGNTLALACGAIALVIIVPPIGLTALAWVGAVGLGLLALAAGTSSVVAGRSARSARRRALGAGLLFGAALLFRADLVLAVVLGGGALWRAYDRPRRRALGTGAALGVAPYLVHFATAGPGNVWRGMVLDPVVYLRGGRRLPLPPPVDHLAGFLQKAGDFGPQAKLDWPVPTLTSAQQIFVWFWFLLASVAVALWVAWRARRRSGVRAVTLQAVALFGAGLLPQALQRSDSAHLAWVSCVPVAFLPVVLRELVRSSPRLQRAGGRWSRGRRANALAAAAVILFIALVIPRYIANSYTDYALQSFGAHRYSYRIERDGRAFYYGKREVAVAAQRGVLPLLEDVTEPGDALVVATSDLRKTPYSDAYLYYLFPELEVGTYYIEMDPGVANAADGKLRDDIAHADVLVLSAVWDDWDEPNDARKVIENGANEVVRSRFVCLLEFGRREPTERAPVDFLYQVWIRQPLFGSGFGYSPDVGRPCRAGLAADR
jgi:hypothetical protein